MRKTVDARFEYVAGPMRPGDEHPGHPGWLYTGRRGRDGELLWYRPPGNVSRWVRRLGLWVYWGLMAFAMLMVALFER